MVLRSGRTASLFDAWVIPSPLGGSPRKIVELGRAVRWSPDGKQILFVRAGASAGDALFVATEDGGSPREIVGLRGGMHIHWPTWSADGRYIYFNYSIQTSNSEPASIYRVRSTGGPIEAVVPTARRAVFPVPTPDGKGLIYSSNPFGVDLALWWRPIHASTATRLTTGVGEYAETSIAADGRAMICTLVQQKQSLVAFRIDPSGAYDGPPRPVTDGSTGDFDPTLSPRGDQLVFSSSRSGYRNLWTMRPDGGDARPLTSGNAFDERPAFSPDGQRIAFVSDRGGRRGIWIISAEGGLPQRLVDAMVIDRLSWSADGARIAYATTVGDAPGLESVTIADRTIRRVQTPGAALCPQWLADGRMAFLEPLAAGPRKPNVNHLALLSPAALATSSGALGGLNLGNGFFAFSPDMRLVAALVDPGGSPGSVWIARLDGDAEFRKVADLAPDVRPRGAAWATDDSRLLVGTVRRSSHLVLFDQAR